MDLISIGRFLSAADIGLYLEGREKNLFLYRLPPTVQRGALLREPQFGTPIDHELPGLYRTEFQVIVRHDDEEKGRELASQVSAALNLVERQISDVMYAYYIRPRNLPVGYPVSEGGYREFSVNFDIYYRTACS